ncbi:hypothetical protein WN48_07398 [Eufriesea mexicana]|uniref:Uncharacterized protein n=1 Tax=Eufriesea mexicana TaxID=516756 RepID=A0A310SHH0_9HYME|nr:hypothetical protein WN48_07398 [Eufriesea mexicana]
MTRTGVAQHDRRHKGVEGRSCAPSGMQVRPSFAIHAPRAIWKLPRIAPARCAVSRAATTALPAARGNGTRDCKPGLKTVH